MKHFAFVLALMMGMLCLTPMTKTTGSALRAECVKITGNNVRLRRGPSTDYAIYCTLSKGTVLTYLDKSYDNNWYVVSYQGERLYVSRDFASLCDCGNRSSNNSNRQALPKAKTECVVHAKDLRLRVGPGTNYDYLIWLETGKTVHVNHGDILQYLGVTENGFYKVRYKGYDCWVSSDYCTLR